MSRDRTKDLRVSGHPSVPALLTEDLLGFLVTLEREFRGAHQSLLHERVRRRTRARAGELPDFPAATQSVQNPSWHVPSAPKTLRNCQVELTGPVTDRRWVIEALNAGANLFTANLEGLETSAWNDVLTAHSNIADAINYRMLNKTFGLDEQLRAVAVRPRGWHLSETNLLVDNAPMSASLFDVGCYLYHIAQCQRSFGASGVLYLPQLETRSEARLWREVIAFSEEELSLQIGSVRITVLVETAQAVFEVEEILFELREYACGLSAGRCDQWRLCLDRLGGSSRPGHVVELAAVARHEFLSTYGDLLVSIGHRRGAHVIGGTLLARLTRQAFDSTDRWLSAIAVASQAEAKQGFDGTVVSSPTLIPVVRHEFEAVLREDSHQLGRSRPDVAATRSVLLAVSPPREDTGTTLADKVAQLLQFLVVWPLNTSPETIDGSIIDAATAESYLSQIWQSLHPKGLSPRQAIARSTVDEILVYEGLRLKILRNATSEDITRAQDIFRTLVFSKEFVPSLNSPALYLLT